MTPEEFRHNGYALIDLIADYQENIESAECCQTSVRATCEPCCPNTLPREPEPWEAVVADINQIIIPNLASWQHPNWFAYFPANTSYSSILGELLSAGVAQQGMSWVTSPACTEVETLMVDWMHELLGLPERFRSTSERGGGVIQGSASEATLVAILAARWRATNGAVNADGDTSRARGVQLGAGAFVDREGSTHRWNRHCEYSTGRPRLEVRHGPCCVDRAGRVRPGIRTGAVLRLHHARHHLIVGVRPHVGGRRGLSNFMACGCTWTQR